MRRQVKAWPLRNLFPSTSRRWFSASVFVVLLLVLAVAADWWIALPPEALDRATYVGRDACTGCHEKETHEWIGSDHDLAMDRATPQTVLGNFDDCTFTHIAFDQLILLPDDQLRALLNAAEVNDLALALHDAPSHVAARFEQLLPDEKRGRLQQRRRWLYAVRPCDQTDAYRRLGDLARRLEREGKLDASFAVTSRMFQREGKYFVTTDNAEGKAETFQIKYVFGVRPLQQYLVEFPDGRIQCLPLAWDTEQRSWFHLYPKEPIPHGDVLHWTGRAQNWNYMCADCHTTNLQKNYDVTTDTYHTTWSEIDVSCEACHGPGSVHVQLAEAWSLFWDRRVGYGLAKLKGPDSRPEIETCAPCHARRLIVYPGHKPGAYFYDHFTPETLEGELYYADGQVLDEDYVYGSFIQSLMYRKGVRCTDCHNPHTARIKTESPESPRPKATENEVCGQCHLPTKYDTPNHHHHPDATKPGTHCVECHMPETKYMVVDPRRDHSIRIPRPDLTVKLGIPNACNLCHNDPQKGETAQWAEDWVRRWYGPMEDKEKEHFALAIAAGRQGRPDAVRKLAAVARRDDLSAMVRGSAIRLLSHYRADESLGAALRGLEDPDPLVRVLSVRSLEGLPPDDLHRWLVKMLHDRRRAVRTEAALLLSALPSSLFAKDDLEALRSAIDEYLVGQQNVAEQPGAHINMAVVYGNLGRYDEAEQEYLTALRLDPNFLPARNNLAMLYDQLGKKRRAEEQFRLMIAAEPDVPEPYYYLGLLVAEDSSRLSEACDLLTTAARLAPGNPRIHYNRGLALQRLGRTAEAEKALKTALRLAPQVPDYLYALCTFYVQQQQWAEARSCARQLLRLQPNNSRWQALLEEIRRRESGK